MPCQQCNSGRISSVLGHCVDRFTAEMDGKEFGPHYIPDDMGIGAGDDLEIEYCLDCGQIQGDFPVFPAFFEPEEED